MKIPKTRSKYLARGTTVDGIRFASKKEAGRYVELKRLQAIGKVKWFIRQPSFDLPGNVRYRADFLVVKQRGEGHEAVGSGLEVVVEDVKGFFRKTKKGTKIVGTETYRVKKKMVEAIYGIEIQER